MKRRIRKFALAGIVAAGLGSVALADDLGPPEPRKLAVPTVKTELNAASADRISEDRDAAIGTGVLSDADEDIETIRERYSDGTIKIEREVRQDSDLNYIRHGVWRYFSKTGGVIAEGFYRDDLMHGAWQRWHRGDQLPLFQEAPYRDFTGPFLSEVDFKAGKMHGKWTIYDSKQRLISEVSFRDGIRDGIATWHYPNGQKSRQINFRDGVVDGDLIRWDEEGKVTVRKTYLAGRLSSTETVRYPKSKQVKSEIRYLSPQNVIDEPDYWWYAKTAKFAVKGDKIRHGSWTTYHSNGKKKATGEYTQGQTSGSHTSWHVNGQMAVQGQYEDGKEIGKWTWWHKNGQKQVQGEYEAGDKSGLWVWWDANGAVAHKRHLQPKAAVSQQLTDGKTL